MKMPGIPSLSEYVRCIESRRAGWLLAVKRHFLEGVWEEGKEEGRGEGRRGKDTQEKGTSTDKAGGGWRW